MSRMRPIWKGSISFGLVTIPVAIVTATRREDLKFRMLRDKDMSPINYKRVAEVDGKEVPWEHIVKGFEYEKGKFVVMKDEDFEKVEVEGHDSITIVDFVDLDRINPIHFYKPYYLEPQKGGAAAYALLREVLADTGKVGIAKVVIRNRQHLAAVKANGPLLVLELMHFAEEITPPESVKVPAGKEVGDREIQMARTLVEQMSSEWKPTKYKDEYAESVMKLIEKKVALGGKELPGAKKQAPAATNVIDLVAVLQKSLGEAGKGEKNARAPKRQPPKRGRKKATPKRTAHKRAA
jgi:DNA end-binding protein Ku